jgi:aerobic-type carbon monoxide dehydrogenase small subunit (CoxS/CutS family)
MSEEEKKDSRISRREFLKDAGLIVGGATVGSMALVNACGTKTITAPGATTTKTVTSTVTSTVSGPGGATVTTTVTAPGSGSTATVTATKTVTTPPVTQQVGAEGVVTLKVNGQNYKVEVQPDWSLAWVLREKLGMVGTKVGCDRGECGSCTVHIDDRSSLACMWLAPEAAGHDIITIEGLANGATLHVAQQNFIDKQSFQCGFCTPGMVMSAAALYKKIPKPTLAQVKEGMSGNLCYCGDHTRIVDAVMKGGQ